jgi:pyrroline-5-carboxylate reductase
MSKNPIILVGAGRMGGALLAGWLRGDIGPVLVVEPEPSEKLKATARKHHVALFPSVASLDALKARACIVAIKPQILKAEIATLAPIAHSGALMLSIAAGTSTTTMRKALGKDARIVRAMPNTPGAIGQGITALYAPAGASTADRKLAETLVGALGETIWVPRESDIDAVTAVSGSGPAYVFLMVEALAAAGVAEGLSPDTAARLARVMVQGAGALLAVDPSPPVDLRRAVTSPKGTTEAALKVLMAKNGLTPLIRRAVAAARKRGAELGS